MIGLLRLPEEIKEYVVDGKLSMTHARILSKMSDKDIIVKLAHRIINEGLSVRDLEDIAKGNEINKLNKVERKVKESDMKYKYAEELLSEKLESKVRVFKNKVEVKFKDADDLNRILLLLNIGK